MSITEILIESESAEHFYNMQDIANKYTRQVICVYGGCRPRERQSEPCGRSGKGCSSSRNSLWHLFCQAEEVVSFLNGKFGESDFPKYQIKEINSEDVEALHR